MERVMTQQVRANKCCRFDPLRSIFCGKPKTTAHPWCPGCRSRFNTRHKTAHSSLRAEIATVRKALTMQLNALALIESDVELIESVKKAGVERGHPQRRKGAA
jgi:hypothetical protein